MLNGKIVKLCQIEESDLPKFRDWRNSSFVRNYVREYRPLNMQNQKQWFESLTNDKSNIIFAIKELKSNKTIGACKLTYIDWKEGHGEVGIYIGDGEWQGKGCAGEALELLMMYGFLELRLHRVCAIIYSYNILSIKLFERHGFRYEGLQREARFWNGKFYDEMIYGILDYEYKETIKESMEGSTGSLGLIRKGGGRRTNENTKRNNR